MLKDFFRHSALYSLASLLTKGISFILLPLYTAVLSPSDFGIIDFITVVGALVAVTVTLEVTQSLHRFVPEFLGTEEPRLYASTALWFSIVCYLVFLVLFGLFSEYISVLMFDTPSNALLVEIASILYFVNAIFYLMQSQLRSELKIKENILCVTLSALSVALFTALALLVLNLGVKGAIISIILGNVVGIFFAYFFSRNSFCLTFSFEHLKIMLRYSVPLIPSSVGVISAMYVDRVSIKEMMSLHELGIYGVASRVAFVTSLLTVGFQQALSPLIYSKFKDSKTPGEIANLFRIFMLLATVFFIVITLFRHEIVMLVADESFSSAGDLVPYLCASVILSTLYIFFPGLAIQGRTAIISAISLFAAAVNLALNFLLIPQYGLVGAAFASCVSAFLGFLLYYVCSQRYYHIPIFVFPARVS